MHLVTVTVRTLEEPEQSECSAVQCSAVQCEQHAHAGDGCDVALLWFSVHMLTWFPQRAGLPFTINQATWLGPPAARMVSPKSGQPFPKQGKPLRTANLHLWDNLLRLALLRAGKAALGTVSCTLRLLTCALY